MFFFSPPRGGGGVRESGSRRRVWGDRSRRERLWAGGASRLWRTSLRSFASCARTAATSASATSSKPRLLFFFLRDSTFVLLCLCWSAMHVEISVKRVAFFASSFLLERAWFCSGWWIVYCYCTSLAYSGVFRSVRNAVG